MNATLSPDVDTPPAVSPLAPLLIVLKALASLQFTVALFALSLVLVFFGTVAQIDNGIWVVVDRYFWSWAVMIPFELLAKIGHVFFFLPTSTNFPGRFPFPAGKMLALLLCINIVAAHLVRFRLTWKRSGVLILHAGLLLLLAGEVITREASLEQQMLIDEGGAANYAADIRNAELVFIAKGKDGRVIGLPQSRLVQGTTIRDAALPVDVYVKEFLRNSKLEKREATTDDANPATVGVGLLWKAKRLPEVSGVDNEQKHDIPAAYLEFKNKETGASLGTHLVSMQIGLMDNSEDLSVIDTTYEVTLRPSRYYKPFTLQLQNFRFDKYVGTRKAKNYSSEVRLIDPELGVDEVVTISMNNPLRHRGETFYQSSFDEVNESYTILQVVRNPGWLLPYAACVVVSLGMMIHFSIVLYGFLWKRFQRRADDGPVSDSVLKKWLPALAVLSVAIAFGGVAGRAMTVPGDGYDLDGFSRIPVADGGRIKPIDTVARVHLRMMSGSEVFKTADGSQPAVKWLLDTMTAGDFSTKGPAYEYPVFYIENEHVLALLALWPRPGFKYSLAEIAAKWEPFAEAFRKAEEKKDKERTPDERKVLEVGRKFQYFLGFNQGSAPQMLALDPAAENWQSLAELRQKLRAAAATTVLAAAGIKPEDARNITEEQARELGPKLADELDRRMDEQTSVALWNGMIRAYKLRDPDRFNEAVAQYHRYLDAKGVPLTSTRLEIILNRMQPLYYVIGFYVVAFGLAFVGFLVEGWAEPLRKAALGVMLVTLALHVVALILRMIIQGRPPVTNLYSSAVYIGCGCAGLSILMEFIYRRGVATVIGAVLGFGASLIAHNLLGSNEDTLEMMQAVLDTNFWLATHVTCITFGYVATYVASAFGIAWIIAAVFVPSTTRDQGKDITRMTYGITCFATFLSFVGTVLGGIWADQSWGRFWGWDPKENGAILLVIWNVLILHARWAGLIKDRGIAVLAVLGGCVTTWSWFGTNQLSVGLHAYGFSSELARLCLGVWCVLGVVAGVGTLIPRAKWASHLAQS
jgi:ABC-type transport system involved in cytochrome c biogenesis permease subunit